MFDNPQQEVNNTSKKLRPIKLSDEAFELFYKEIYAEFGPKDVPPVELNPKKEVREEVLEEAPAEVAEEIPAEIAEEIPEETAEEAPQEETEEPEIEVEEEDIDEDDEEDLEEDDEDEDEDDDEDDAVQEEAAKAAAAIMNIQEDEVIDEDTEGVTLVKPKKQKGIKGLVFTICLELLAIAGIVAYWLMYIL